MKKAEPVANPVDDFVRRQEYLRVVEELKNVKKHRDILAEALAEIKAIYELDKTQTYEDVLDGCIAEVTKHI